MRNPLIADLLVQVNLKAEKENNKWFEKLSQKYKAMARREGKIIFPETVVVNGFVIPSNDLQEINDHCATRIAKRIGHKIENVKVIEVLNSRLIIGYGAYEEENKSSINT